jgi:hypothetical protein
MKLLTKALEKRFKQVGRQDSPDAVVICKFFNPNGAGTWYAVAFDGEDQFFGYVTGLGTNELGSFSLAEFLSFKGRMGLGIERDLYFEETPLKEIMEREP